MSVHAGLLPEIVESVRSGMFGAWHSRLSCTESEHILERSYEVCDTSRLFVHHSLHMLLLMFCRSPVIIPHRVSVFPVLLYTCLLAFCCVVSRPSPFISAHTGTNLCPPISATIHHCQLSSNLFSSRSYSLRTQCLRTSRPFSPTSGRTACLSRGV